MDPQASSKPRAGVVAVILRGDRLLVIRRSQSVVAPLAYCFPGGRIEEGETEEAALVRELQEELSVDVRPVRQIWRSVTPWGVSLGWWFAVLGPEITPSPNPTEVESFYWLTPTEMEQLDPLLESNRHFLAALAAGEINLG